MKTKIILGLGVLVAVFFGAYFAMKAGGVSASVPISGEYQATSTTNIGTGHIVIGLRNASPDIAQSSTTLSVLGSVIVASSSATAVTLWDATSTSDVSSSTIAIFKSAISEGVYTFDIILKRGLIINLPTGDNGSYTITYR